MSLELKAELVMALKDYERVKEKLWNGGIDFTVSNAESDDKILMRVIKSPKSKSGYVGLDAVSKMIKTMKNEDYDKGVLVCEKCTEAAKRELKQESIQMISKNLIPRFEPQELFLAIEEYVDKLCKSKCGKIPQKESDCRSQSDDCYSCKIRLISDNASFHFECGWTKLLRNDLMRLLAIQHSL